jgi:mono/diheme cytochrome c family protein
MNPSAGWHTGGRWIGRQPVVSLGILILAGTAVAAAEPSPREIRQQIDAVDRLLATGKPEEAAASLASAIEGLEVLAAQPQSSSGLKFLSDRARRAVGKLDKAGIDVSRLSVAEPEQLERGRPPAARPAAAAGVSFSQQIAPFLAATCGRCHVAGRKGGFQMASYDQLMRSAKVSPGMGRQSELVEVILSGEMPPGGSGVSPEQVGMLISWIDSGAACDADPTADLMTVARAATAPPPPVIAAPPRPLRLKPGEVSFASDVVPVLLDQCVNCHGDRDPENNFRLTSLEALKRGGRTGPAVVPGKGAESLLVKKLRGVGIEGQRMPLGKAPLPAEQIAVIVNWIDQGARIDLLTPADSLDAVAAAGRSQRLSDDELARIRFAAGEALWGRIIPDESPAIADRPGLRLVGNLPPDRLDQLAAEAADVAGRVGRELGLADGPLAKGGVVLYAFRKAYDYSELWQVVLRSERPRGIDGHAGVSGDVAYGAVVIPAGDQAGDDIRGLLAEQLAAAALAARGLPQWFCQGGGRAVAMRLAAKSQRVQDWKRNLGGAVRELGSPADFFSGRSDPAAAALAAGGFVSSLAGGGKLARMVALFDEGTPFEEAFAATFRSPPQQAFGDWAARTAGR